VVNVNLAIMLDDDRTLKKQRMMVVEKREEALFTSVARDQTTLLARGRCMQ
jgi:hypothetical protein